MRCAAVLPAAIAEAQAEAKIGALLGTDWQLGLRRLVTA
jgi:hypothetical protein